MKIKIKDLSLDLFGNRIPSFYTRAGYRVIGLPVVSSEPIMRHNHRDDQWHTATVTLDAPDEIGTIYARSFGGGVEIGRGQYEKIFEEKKMDAWNPMMEVDQQVEQAVKELEEEVMEEMQFYADLPEMLKE